MYKAPTLPLGTVLQNRYQMLRKLSSGGYGAVYLAQDNHLNCYVAVKELTHPSQAAQELFRQEASVLAKLNHPNLVRVSNFFYENRSYFLVMDYIDGEDLLKVAQDTQNAGNTLAVSQVLNWMVQISDAVSYLHHLAPPVIHRDIKPANIRLTKQGRAVLVDFGIAKIDPRAKTQMMAQAISIGFSPPEQYLDTQSTDARSDVYALGATMYCLVTLVQPTDSMERLNGQHSLKPPTQRNPRVSPEVEEIILQAMEVAPAKRYVDAGQLLTVLQQAVNHQSAQRAGLPAEVTQRTCPRCGTHCRKTARFCPKCGTSLAVNVCPHCGARNRGGARFCAQCRTRLVPQP